MKEKLQSGSYGTKGPGIGGPGTSKAQPTGTKSTGMQGAMRAGRPNPGTECGKHGHQSHKSGKSARG